MHVRPRILLAACALGGLIVGGAAGLLLAINPTDKNELALGDSVSISYVITDYTDAANPKEVARGTRSYSSLDVQVEQRGRGKQAFLSESIELASGYRIGASIYRETHIDGFGLWAKLDNHSFSWEWFDQSSGEMFRKLQESGRVRVTFRNKDGLQELASVTFES